jgi:hypothetical protein
VQTTMRTTDVILGVAVLKLAPLVILAFWSHLTAWPVIRGKKGERCGIFWCRLRQSWLDSLAGFWVGRLVS